MLIGCGTFSVAARAEFETRVEARINPRDRECLEGLTHTEAGADRRLAEQGRVMARVFGYDVEEIGEDIAVVDAAAHQQSWADMLRLQRDGTYPAAFAAIGVPVLMIHGEQDPHPGRLISQDLRVHIPHLEYRELPHCGHSPWLERQAKLVFFDTVNAWLEARFRPTACPAR